MIEPCIFYPNSLRMSRFFAGHFYHLFTTTNNPL